MLDITIPTCRTEAYNMLTQRAVDVAYDSCIALHEGAEEGSAELIALEIHLEFIQNQLTTLDHLPHCFLLTEEMTQEY